MMHLSNIPISKFHESSINYSITYWNSTYVNFKFYNHTVIFVIVIVSLQFASSPLSFNNPAGLFLSFLEKLKQFFTTTSNNKSPYAVRSSTPYDNQDVGTENIFPSLETSGQQRISGETMNYRQSENDDYDDYYHSNEVSFQQINVEFNFISPIFLFFFSENFS